MLDETHCMLCPRRCGVDRTRIAGRCGQTATMRIARAALHFWEEPPITGTNGSGTVFFSGCPLRCVYCQNAQISREGIGEPCSVEELAAHFQRLERLGGHNLNLVTATQFAPAVRRAVSRYRQEGGRLPVVWNTSGYERVETVEALAKTVQIYLTDLRYANAESAAKYSAAPDYPAIARAALHAMVRTAGPWEQGSDGILRRGVLVRLLVLPSMEYEAMMNLKFLWETFGDTIGVSVMNQYTPVGASLPEELREPVSPAAYETVVEYARKRGFSHAFMQEGETARESFVPPFSGTVTLE